MENDNNSKSSMKKVLSQYVVKSQSKIDKLKQLKDNNHTLDLIFSNGSEDDYSLSGIDPEDELSENSVFESGSSLSEIMSSTMVEQLNDISIKSIFYRFKLKVSKSMNSIGNIIM